MSNLTINGSNLNVNSNIYSNNPHQRNEPQAGVRIDAKKENARSQAFKLISDAWDNDKKTEGFVKEMKNEKNQKALQLGEINSMINALENDKESLKKEYGIQDDSAEQKDLLLLLKYQDNKNGVSFDRFSEEEIGRLKELQNTELTEYQKKALELNGTRGNNIKMSRDIEAELQSITLAMTDVEINKNKSQGMIKAEKASDLIMEAVGKEAVGMLIEESMEHLEEEAKAAKKESDKKKDESDEILEAQKKIRDIIKENNLISEDIKGIEIDLNF